MYRTLLATLALLPLIAGRAAAQPKFDPPKTYPPDAATLRQIEAKTAELRKAVEMLPLRTNEDYRSDVEVYLKAAEWIARHGEWFQKDSAKHTLAVLDAGLNRARWAKLGQAPWRDVEGKPVVRGYRSRVDGSVQPYSVTLPVGYRNGRGPWRYDTVLHGRDQTLTEVKFIHAREAAKTPANPPDRVVIEPYGRGNNAYRWAGETDVFEAQTSFVRTEMGRSDPPGDYGAGRKVLRGFSMGGAGTWHIGLHHPLFYAAISPGAGFTTTHGYVKNLPDDLPDYVAKCLHIYDAADYAENVFHVPVVAYSGEKDPQKAAADAIEARLRKFREKVSFTHLIAPGLEHRMPPEWQAKADAEIAKHLPRKIPDRLRFVTYTTRYGHAWWATVEGMDRHYDKAILYGTWTKDGMKLDATNVRVIRFHLNRGDIDSVPEVVQIDGQQVRIPAPRASTLPPNLLAKRMFPPPVLVKRDGKWTAVAPAEWDAQLARKPEKGAFVRGPIDDAFLDGFAVVRPEGPGWHPEPDAHAKASADRFEREWDKYYRGRLPSHTTTEVTEEVVKSNHLVLFGDPASNPLIAKVVGKLPITWTKDKLVVNDVEYDPKTHVPVLIYPNPLNPFKYVVINSGHTFHEADLKGTNALLYPRLGDWAVLKPTPTEKDPAAAEVVAAGLFDEFWQLPK